MAITAMGLGNKAAPEGANLDPQREFWSWLAPFVNPDDKGADSGHHERGYFSGFACTQTAPAGMSIKIGGGSIADSALLVLTDGRCVLLSTNGEPEIVTIPTAPASGRRIDAVVSYIDTTSPTPDTETPGTPEYVHTIVVSGTASSNPSAPTDSQIVNALPAGANSKYYRWCDVKVAASQTVITNSDITDKKPMSPNLYWTTQDIKSLLPSLAPDYGAKVNISSEYYTPPANGILYVAAILNTNVYNSTADIKVDNAIVFHAQNAREDLANYNVQSSAIIPVRQGRSIHFVLQNGASWGARYFAPWTFS